MTTTSRFFAAILAAIVGNTPIATRSASNTTKPQQPKQDLRSTAHLFGPLLDRLASEMISCDTPQGKDQTCIHPKLDYSSTSGQPDGYRYIELRPQHPSYKASNLIASIDDDGRIKLIQMDTTGIHGHAAAYAALNQALGKPDSVMREHVQNRFGANFERVSASWHLPDGSVSYRSIDTQIDAGTIMMYRLTGRSRIR